MIKVVAPIFPLLLSLIGGLSSAIASSPITFLPHVVDGLLVHPPEKFIAQNDTAQDSAAQSNRDRADQLMEEGRPLLNGLMRWPEGWQWLDCERFL